MRRTQLECIVFRKKENTHEFLLLKRIPQKGGFWQPPCGGLEKEDRSKLDAAYRELFEEANITQKDVLKVFKDVDSFEINKHYFTGEPIPAITEYVYGFEISSSIPISIHNNPYPEHDQFVWVTFEKALELLKWDNNKVALTKLNKRLGKIKEQPTPTH